VEEGLLLDGVELQSTVVAPRDVELPPFVETHLADALPPVGDDAAVSASIAPYSIVREPLVKLTLPDMLV
jgi:hypothetical protein